MGVTKNRVEAFSWYRKAASQGNEHAKKKLSSVRVKDRNKASKDLEPHRETQHEFVFSIVNLQPDK